MAAICTKRRRTSEVRNDVGKADGPRHDHEGPQPPIQIPAMLRALLVERFKLAARLEDRRRPVYALIVDKGGPKFKEADLNFSRMGQRPGQVTFGYGPATRAFKGAMTMTKPAQFLSGRLDRPVQDSTALKGTYDIDLTWTPDPGIDRPSPPAASFATATTCSMSQRELINSRTDAQYDRLPELPQAP
jgi:uncharacterized protein (TIGR03435 family)